MDARYHRMKFKSKSGLFICQLPLWVDYLKRMIICIVL